MLLGNVNIKPILIGNSLIKECYLGNYLIYKSAKTIKRYLLLQELSEEKTLLAGSSGNGYVLFTGGDYYNSYNTIVETYNMNLGGVRVSGLSLPENTEGMAGAGSNANGYAVFAGGNGKNSGWLTRVLAYNMKTGGSRTTLSPLNNQKEIMIGASTEGYAVFAGGRRYDVYYKGVESYNMNSSGAKTTLTDLSYTRIECGGAGANGYIVFAGGRDTMYAGATVRNNVEVYNMNSSGAKSTLVNLATAKFGLGSADANGYAVFAGGYGTSVNGQVEAYDMKISGAKSTLTGITAKSGLAGANSNAYAVFAGGSNYSSTVDAYNMESGGTKSTLNRLVEGRISPGGATGNGYAVFAGGKRTSLAESNKVEAFLPG